MIVHMGKTQYRRACNGIKLTLNVTSVDNLRIWTLPSDNRYEHHHCEAILAEPGKKTRIVTLRIINNHHIRLNRAPLPVILALPKLVIVPVRPALEELFVLWTKLGVRWRYALKDVLHDASASNDDEKTEAARGICAW